MADIASYQPMTGRHIKEDGTVVNMADYYLSGGLLSLDYGTAVARGLVPGARPWGAYGRAVSAGAAAGVIWPNGAFVFPPAAGLQMSVVSTSAQDASGGSGAFSIDIHYLDADLVEMVETVVLNGLTPVLTVATGMRFINYIHVKTGLAAAGTISAKNGATTYSEISVGQLLGSSSVRMVPIGKKLLVTSFFGGSVSGAAAAGTEVFMASPNFEDHDFTTSNLFIQLASGAFQDGSSGLTIPCPMVFTAGQSVGMTYLTDKAAVIVGSWFGILENA